MAILKPGSALQVAWLTIVSPVLQETVGSGNRCGAELVSLVGMTPMSCPTDSQAWNIYGNGVAGLRPCPGFRQATPLPHWLAVMLTGSDDTDDVTGWMDAGSVNTAADNADETDADGYERCEWGPVSFTDRLSILNGGSVGERSPMRMSPPTPMHVLTFAGGNDHALIRALINRALTTERRSRESTH